MKLNYLDRTQIDHFQPSKLSLHDLPQWLLQATATGFGGLVLTAFLLAEFPALMYKYLLKLSAFVRDYKRIMMYYSPQDVSHQVKYRLGDGGQVGNGCCQETLLRSGKNRHA